MHGRISGDLAQQAEPRARGTKPEIQALGCIPRHHRQRQ
jgi:hypothetical protein